MSQRIDSIGTTTTKPTSDRSTSGRPRMLPIAYLLVCALAGARAAIIGQSPAGLEPLQQLVHERLVAQQHQQQHQQHHTVTANDLQELPEQPAPAPALASRPMINGNHATYVEPPADFKPIIYETSDFAAVNQLQGAGSGGGGPPEADSNWAGSELKPSIGRWSDWHDMSIEPDLASSDSSPPVAYRTRYYGAAKTAAETDSPGQQQEEHQVNAVSGQELQIKGARRAPLTWPRPLQSPSRLTKAAGANLPLKLISSPAAAVQSPQQQQTPAKIEHTPHHQPLNHATPAAAWANHYQQQNANHSHNQSQLQPQVAQQEQQQVKRRGLKRRRKSKSNAEVRIQQLVAASQQQQQQQQLQHQLQHQEHQQLALMRDAGRYKQVNGRFGALNQLKEQPQPHHRVPSQQPVLKSLAQPQTTLLKRFAANPNQGQQPQVNSSGIAKPRANGVVAQRRRSRIKTLLPVGLSSWFLGGIRDLDGRHWQLPGEVISRLAVNDVDFGPRPALELEQSLGELATARPARPQPSLAGNHRPEAIPR